MPSEPRDQALALLGPDALARVEAWLRGGTWCWTAWAPGFAVELSHWDGATGRAARLELRAGRWHLIVVVRVGDVVFESSSELAADPGWLAAFATLLARQLGDHPEVQMGLVAAFGSPP